MPCSLAALLEYMEMVIADQLSGEELVWINRGKAKQIYDALLHLEKLEKKNEPIT